MAPLTAEELRNHPEFPNVWWKLEPTKKERFPVAKDRGGPINIVYEIHGSGPIHMMFVMGLGSFKTAWQRQTKLYGHEQGSKYSTLILDNRGMGESDKPVLRYKTSDMAKDVVEVLDHVGWTSKRELHLIGISMGGMISQELAMLIPDRIASLTLLSTAAQMKNTAGFIETWRNRINIVIPKSLDEELAATTNRLLNELFLDQKDIDAVFPTNRDRWAAQELKKRSDTEGFTRSGFFCQIAACLTHKKTAAQLKQIGDTVGRERIQVIHGSLDRMITVVHSDVTIEGLQGPGLSTRIFEGSGHVIPMENRDEFNELMIKFIDRTEKLGKET